MMAGWNTKRRFWEEVLVVPAERGFTVTLDGRGVKTPAKTPLVLPTSALAEAIALEWQNQGEEIDPLSMPVTRCANSALDKVAHQHAEVANMLADYAGTDLLCYRAEAPDALVARQADTWDPLLDWADQTLNARLLPVRGVMFQAQDSAALERLAARVREMSPFQLAAFHDLVALSGSLIIGFAVIKNYATATRLWDISRLDDLWQEEQWGSDEEAQEVAGLKRQAFLNADRFYKMC